MDKPTFRASILTGGGVNFSERRCHSFVTDGRIEFLNDCHHALKGKTVDLPDIDHVNDDSAAAKMMFGEDPILNAD